MAKKTKSIATKEPVKKERELFSVKRSGLKIKKKLERNVKVNHMVDDDSDDEQMQEIKKIQQKTHKLAPGSKDVKSRMRICYDTMVSGTVVGCCVSQVLTDRIIVSLPYRMMGFIPLTHVSAAYTKLMHQLADGVTTSEEANTLPQLYRSGQFLTVAVANNMSTNGFKGLPLSLYPCDVNGNSVSVSSVKQGCVLQCGVVASEDNGYTLDTGVRGVTVAFLPAKDAPKEVTIGVGSVLPCVVTAVRGDQSSVSLTVSAIAADVVNAAAKPSNRQYGLNTPGTTVEGFVTKSTTQGVSLLIGSEEDYYASMEAEDDARWEKGLISPMHLRGPFDQCHLFRVGQKLQPKILFVTTFPRMVYLTLNRNVLNYSLADDHDPRHGLALGSIIPGASVLDCNSVGLSVRVSDKCRGFCSINKVPGAKKLTELSKKHPVGQQLPCKLIAFNTIDQVFLISIKPEDVRPKKDDPKYQVGMVMPVTIVQHFDSGAKVQTKSGVEGFVRKIHLTDTNMAAPKNKLPVGKTVQAKLIQVEEKEVENSIRRKYFFTLKSLLLNSELPIIKSYTEGNVGIETKGVISTVSEERLFMEFCGSVRGLLNAKNFSSEINLAAAYQPGDVLQVKIVGLGNSPKPLYFLASPMKTKKTKKIDATEAKKELCKIVDMNRTKNNWLCSIKCNLGDQEKEAGVITDETPAKASFSKEIKRKRVLSGKIPQQTQVLKKKKKVL